MKRICQTGTVAIPEEFLAVLQQFLQGLINSDRISISPVLKIMTDSSSGTFLESSSCAQRDDDISVRRERNSAGTGLQMPTAPEVQWHIRLHELRHERFASGLMSDPVWGILLELLRGQIHYRQVSIKCATIASRVPQTTALRHIGQLQERGLIYRFPDLFDRRRTLLALTERGLRTIALLFADMRTHMTSGKLQPQDTINARTGRDSELAESGMQGASPEMAAPGHAKGAGGGPDL